MTPPATIRAYVNGAGVDVAPGATALDCVRAWQPAEADAIAAGTRAITDSRGLPTPGGGAAFPGAIYRTVAARGGRDD
jgi:hypothetical protein